ncbi:MAG: EAL domain-containing protein [Rhodopseudomonas palustris]|uniref:EAL domain-containing protein n=1 Tax=Rhodopseudomonas palustris TaxID=1076 RepID=A0A933VUA1_RHOPL|nr:EAL domain-containing protein [Rhodopseudomonas palustris]
MIRLSDSFANLQSIIDAVPHAIFVKDRTHRIVLLNTSACEFLGHSRATLLGYSDFELFPADQAEIFRAADDHVFQTGEESENEEQLTDGRGCTRHVITRKQMVRLEEVEYLVASVTDITASRVAEAKNHHLSFHDPLTGLPNRSLFEEKLNGCFRNVAEGKHLAVLVLDLDGFKHVNDAYGYVVGDNILRWFAAKVSDLLGPEDVMARIDGDKFAIAMPGIGPSGDATSLASRIVATVRQPFVVDGTTLEFGVGIGIALARDVAIQPDELLRRADRAHHRASAADRLSICYFDAGMDQMIKRRIRIEQELRAAIAGDLIVPCYQPVVSLNGDRIIGFEALARWENESLGQIPSDEFISIAEEAGLIDALSARLLCRACQDASTWPASLFLAFNISPISLRDPTLGLRILGILAKSGFSPHRLELEITESALVDNISVAHTTIDQLRQAGVRIALDDFGTGYATLSQLLSFRLDKIKIDRSFVARLDDSEEGKVIVRAILGLATGFGLTTTAEGIESGEQLAFLKDNGCTEGQGYLFGKAVPASEVDALLNLTPWAVTASAPRMLAAGPMAG